MKIRSVVYFYGKLLTDNIVGADHPRTPDRGEGAGTGKRAL